MQKSFFGDLEESEVRMYVKGVDFNSTLEQFRMKCHGAASSRGLKAATKKMSETEMLVQFYPSWRGPTILCSPLAKCLN